MNILLTGALGQLGVAMKAALGGHDVTSLDVVSLSEEKLDITDFEQVQTVVEKFRPDCILNAAAYTNVDGAETNVHLAYAANALGPRNLAVAAAKLDIPLMHVSTDYVFDGRSSVPYHEFDPPNPLSVYGASKLAGEEAIRSLHRRHFIVRTAWLYHTVGRNFPKTITALANQSVVRVVNDQVGSPTYAPHLALALVRLLETTAYGTYHLAGQGQATWFELTCELYRELGIATRVEPVTSSEFPRPAQRSSFAALTTIQSPCFRLPPWKDGVAEYITSIRAVKRLRQCRLHIGPCPSEHAAAQFNMECGATDR
jgi:dTDP-4-dehydrorhamnose reductase